MQKSHFWIMFLLFGLMSTMTFAQATGDYQTRTGANGNWTTATSWQKFSGGAWGDVATYPTSLDGVITIRSDAVIIYDTSIASVDQLVINGNLTVPLGITFTTADGAGTDVVVNGTFIHQGNVANPMTGTGALNSGGVYIHNTLGASTRMLGFFTVRNANSTWIYRGSSTLNPPVNMSNISYGNLEFESTSGVWNTTWIGTAPTTVNGNFILGINVRLTTTSTGSNIIKGNYTINGTLIYSTGTQVMTFSGINKTIGGAGIVAFEAASIAPAASYTLLSNISENSTFTFTVGGSLNCGTFVVGGPGAFTLSANATLKIGAPAGINGNIQNTGVKTFSTNANYEYNGSSNQVIGTNLPTTISSLAINNPNTVFLSNNLIVSITLTIIMGYLDLGNYNLNGSGSVVGDPNLIFSGTGIASGVGSSIDAFITTLIPTSLPFFCDEFYVQTGAGNNFYLPNDVSTITYGFTSGGMILNHNVFSLLDKDIGFHAPDNTTYINALNVIKTDFPTTVGVDQSISRIWNITGYSSAPVDVTVTWPSPEADAGIIFDNDQGVAWKFNGNSWVSLGVVDIVDFGTSKSATFITTLGAKDVNNDYTITSNDQTLPVELSSFTAVLTAQNLVNLTWTTQSETNMSGFYIFRSQNAVLADAELVSPIIPATNTSGEQIYAYQDAEVESNITYNYWLEATELNNNGTFHGPIVVTIGNGGEVVPPPVIDSKTCIEKVYPNPFNPRTEIAYNLKSDANVTLSVYNHKGQLIRTLVNDNKISGYHRITWDGNDINGIACASGIYYVKMHAGNVISARKLVLMK